MNLIALMPACNEAWILGLSLRVALRWCDSVVVLNHASTDCTAGILDAISDEHPNRVAILNVEDPTWNEMLHRQAMLDVARRLGATHCAIVDADEVLTSNLVGLIKIQLEQLAPGGFLQVPMRNMWRAHDWTREDPFDLGIGRYDPRLRRLTGNPLAGRARWILPPRQGAEECAAWNPVAPTQDRRRGNAYAVRFVAPSDRETRAVQDARSTPLAGPGTG